MSNNNQGRSGQGNQDGQVTKSNRGFASMDQEKQRAIASKGGKAAHEYGTAHEFTSEEAREAGRKGGLNSANRNRNQQNQQDQQSQQNL